ncbi:MAG: signal peptidase I [Acidobacteria bacterium]|nr:signal peptidase I [Acidobacteriota bacterium]MBP7474691.1 signal peptidase I [Pyrinomonadaceae bacterium]MBP9109631.1 signal peptidase I [Pyrinomonadaceae bacterium]
MLDLRKKNQSDFGFVSALDDRDIEVTHLARESRQGLWSEGFKLIRDIFLIIIVFILFGVFFVQPVVVEGTSMLPQLHDGERLLVNKLVYYKIQNFSWGHIERGDIVVFWFPNDPDKSYVKRVIGLPGETVELRGGRVFVDGKELNEEYLDKEYTQSMPPPLSKKVDEHHYFVMGDNRDNSSDSRYWGLVPEKYIYGKAFFRYWKPSNIGFLEHGEYDKSIPATPANKVDPRANER